MKKKDWGPIIWNVLHCIVVKIKDEEFVSERKKIISIIFRICSNLPCPTCAAHAGNILKTYNFENVNTKEELISFIFSLHNKVNKKLNKKPYSLGDLKIYDEMNFRTSLVEYYVMNRNTQNVSKMMLHSFYLDQFLQYFHDYFTKNMSKFNK